MYDFTLSHFSQCSGKQTLLLYFDLYSWYWYLCSCLDAYEQQLLKSICFECNTQANNFINLNFEVFYVCSAICIHIIFKHCIYCGLAPQFEHALIAMHYLVNITHYMVNIALFWTNIGCHCVNNSLYAINIWHDDCFVLKYQTLQAIESN